MIGKRRRRSSPVVKARNSTTSMADPLRPHPSACLLKWQVWMQETPRDLEWSMWSWEHTLYLDAPFSCGFPKQRQSTLGRLGTTNWQAVNYCTHPSSLNPKRIKSSLYEEHTCFLICSTFFSTGTKEIKQFWILLLTFKLTIATDINHFDKSGISQQFFKILPQPELPLIFNYYQLKFMLKNASLILSLQD